MSYLVNKTDGTLLATVFDGQINSPSSPTGSSSITLIGRQVSNYGELQNENFIHMLENFSNSTDPAFPIEGQLWWNKTANTMNVFDGAAWRPVTGFTSSTTQPTGSYTGDQWYDQTNQQVKVYTGTDWLVVGPAYSVLDGKSGALVEYAYDVSTLAKRAIIKLYSNSNVVAIVSNVAEFTPNVSIDGFSSIKPGITFSTTIDAIKLYGTATNSDTVGNLTPSQFLRSDIDAASSANLSIAKQLTVGANSEFNVSITNGDVTLKNTEVDKNFYLSANVGGTSTHALTIDGTSGLMYVAAEPISGLGIVNKDYVDTMVTNYSSAITNDTTGFMVANITSVNDNITANVNTLNNTIASVETGLNDALVANVEYLFNLKANVTSPHLLGIPQAPTPLSNDNSGNIATTEFVTTALTNLYNGQLTTDINNLKIIKANVASPSFTGTPTAPTPLANDNSGNIATTQFVSSAISSFDTTKIYNGASQVKVNSGNIKLTAFGTDVVTISNTGMTTTTQSAGDNSTKVATTAYVNNATKTFVLNATPYTPTCYVSASAPTNSTGNDGDIWFQYQG